MSRLPNAVRETVRHATRERLLAAAADEFAREGYVGANINRISAAAGFAKGTIYNYFPSKQALMLTLIDEIAVLHGDIIHTEIEQHTTPSTQLKAFFQGGFMFVQAHPPQARVVINAIYGPDPTFVARVHQAYAPLYDLLINGILAAGVARGDFRPIDTDPTAGLLMTVYLGSCALLMPDGSLPLDVQQIMAFVLDGLRPRE
ncbi:MAG: TetR/AcrR family transcriptional regulator [Anaerolineae bacterium]|nr:TetR/AcrR family transcriptional regulator [Anaerolineae bacterium]